MQILRCKYSLLAEGGGGDMGVWRCTEWRLCIATLLLGDPSGSRFVQQLLSIVCLCSLINLFSIYSNRSRHSVSTSGYPSNFSAMSVGTRLTFIIANCNFFYIKRRIQVLTQVQTNSIQECAIHIHIEYAMMSILFLKE